MKEHLMFLGKVALAIVIINQITPLQQAIYKNYFAST